VAVFDKIKQLACELLFNFKVTYQVNCVQITAKNIIAAHYNILRQHPWRS